MKSLTLHSTRREGVERVHKGIIRFMADNLLMNHLFRGIWYSV